MVAHINTLKSDSPDLNQPEPKSLIIQNQSLPPYYQPASDCLENKFHWRNIDSLRLLVQIGLTFIIVGLCIGKLTVEDRDKALYWGGIMSIVGWWMPSPGASKSSSGLDK
uniref:Uncharacterized protein n=1 Tax=Oscillatoriales cyanobacterium SpSt-402 TaxID=2282168 RepID=A0A832H2J5_9CYAN